MLRACGFINLDEIWIENSRKRRLTPLLPQASDRLLQLEADLQATPAADQGAALSRVSEALRETAEPALRRGELILNDAGPDQPGTEVSSATGETGRYHHLNCNIVYAVKV